MTVPLKKIKTGHKFRFENVLYILLVKRPFKIEVRNTETRKDLYFDKETPVDPAD